MHESIVRVRYAETDAMRVVHHAVYLVWFEVGRTDYMRAQGLAYTRLESMGIHLPVVEATCRFLQPARYDDELVIRTAITQLSRLKIAFGYEVVMRETGHLLSTGTTLHAFVNDSEKPIHLALSSPTWQVMSPLPVEPGFGADAGRRISSRR